MLQFSVHLRPALLCRRGLFLPVLSFKLFLLYRSESDLSIHGRLDCPLMLQLSLLAFRRRLLPVTVILSGLNR